MHNVTLNNTTPAKRFYISVKLTLIKKITVIPRPSENVILSFFVVSLD